MVRLPTLTQGLTSGILYTAAVLVDTSPSPSEAKSQQSTKKIGLTAIMERLIYTSTIERDESGL